MKPRTIIQKEVVSLQRKLPKITTKHINWVEKMNPYKYARLRKKDIICFECNHIWLQSEKTKDAKYCVCPKCKKRLIIVNHNRKIIDEFYMQILSVVGDFQVFSTFYIRMTSKCGQK